MKLATSVNKCKNKYARSSTLISQFSLSQILGVSFDIATPLIDITNTHLQVSKQINQPVK